ncbi:hypothetical protein C0J52_06778 [Blattella germanica]|nr:hypothetical protein C0J52_06778 [Blattella germanica]
MLNNRQLRNEMKLNLKTPIIQCDVINEKLNEFTGILENRSALESNVHHDFECHIWSKKMYIRFA